MNIFYLHEKPEVCARMHCNKHVVKMILESAQMLCTAHWINGGEAPYKKSFMNHPSTVWARGSLQQYKWLCNMAKNLCKEYTYRYEKKHKTEDIIDWCITNEPKLSNDKFVQPPQCMPIEYKSVCSIKAYRTYYLNDKKGFLDYKKRETPQWIKFDK